MLGLYQLERPFHPLDSVSGIKLWLDATNIDGKQNMTLNSGSNISEWKDLSGNENNAISLTNGSSILISSHSNFGDKSVITFDDITTNSGFDIPEMFSSSPNAITGLIVFRGTKSTLNERNNGMWHFGSQTTAMTHFGSDISWEGEGDDFAMNNRPKTVEAGLSRQTKLKFISFKMMGLIGQHMLTSLIIRSIRRY